MAASGENSLCVLEYGTCKSAVTVQRHVKDRVFVSTLTRDLADLQARTIAAVKNIDVTMLTRVWQELEYRIDVCRVTRGAHIEHLLLSKNLFSFPVAVDNSIKVGPLGFLL
jgi:hypothetical protein